MSATGGAVKLFVSSNVIKNLSYFFPFERSGISQIDGVIVFHVVNFWYELHTLRCRANYPPESFMVKIILDSSRII